MARSASPTTSAGESGTCATLPPAELLIPTTVVHIPRMSSVGANVLRKDSLPKVSGAAKYVDDLAFPGMLHGRTIRSTIPRGTVKAITFDFDQSGFTVAD